MFGIRTAICTPGDGPLRRRCEENGVLQLWLSHQKLGRFGHLIITARGAEQVRDFTKKHRLNVFSCHDLVDGLCLAARLSDQVKTIYYSRDVMAAFRRPRRLRRFLLSYLIKRADAWICNSEFVFRTLSPLTGRREAVIIPNGIELDQLLGIDRQPLKAPDRGAMNIGMAGNFGAEKDQEVTFPCVSYSKTAANRGEAAFGRRRPHPQ